MKRLIFPLFLSLLLGFTNLASAQGSVFVGNPNGVQMDDFHMVFDKPPPKNIRQSITGTVFAQNPVNPNEIVATGFTVGPLGSGPGNNLMSIIGVKIVGANTFAGAAQLLSWCWSKGGSCNDGAGVPWLPPFVQADLGQGLQNFDLQQLGNLGFKIIATPVPEPDTAFLMLSGVVCLGLLRRRKSIA
jgi:hypothetical protein